MMMTTGEGETSGLTAVQINWPASRCVDKKFSVSVSELYLYRIKLVMNFAPSTMVTRIVSSELMLVSCLNGS